VRARDFAPLVIVSVLADHVAVAGVSWTRVLARDAAVRGENRRCRLRR
jgi:hypothetical protein